MSLLAKKIQWIFLPGVVLIIVAFNQIYHAKMNGLSPWKGGGFGMFATTQERFLRSFLILPDGEIPCEIPKQFIEVEAKTTRFPTPKRIQNIAMKLASVKWVVDSTSAIREHQHSFDKNLFQHYAKEKQGTEKNSMHYLMISGVRVECWGTFFRRDKSNLKASKIVEAVYDLNFRSSEAKKGILRHD